MILSSAILAQQQIQLREHFVGSSRVFQGIALRVKCYPTDKNDAAFNLP